MADAFPDEVEPTVTINEFIEGLEAEELEADMVLGGDSGDECTYPNGYMKRQAVFSCLTCVPDGSAGVCTACCLSCHDGHEVVELWTKRNFRCDCGNSKFAGFSCKLSPNKDPENSRNKYNQNFKGSYCTCARAYPDPEAEEQEEMIQCCICEDWFHENHLGLSPPEEVPRDEEGEPLYDEFICQDCSVRCSFLNLYPASIWATSKIPSPEEKEEDGAVQDENPEREHKESVLGLDLNERSLGVEKKKPMFLGKKWRSSLCRCNSCSEFYVKQGVGFLIDSEDSIEEYENVAKRKRQEKMQEREGAELSFLNTLDHVQKIELLNGIAEMKNELQSFMESVDPSKPVTSADVQGIFEKLKKKRRLM
ncbi:PHD finger protein-like protein [Wolffia australiana]